MPTEAELTAQLDQSKAKADAYQKRVHDSLINDAINDACEKTGAYSAKQVKPWLRAVVRSKDDGAGEYVCCLDDEGGALSVLGAVQRMKENVAEFGNLFRGTAQPATTAPAQQGTDALAELAKRGDHAEYRRLRQENPAALGLRPGGSRRR